MRHIEIIVISLPSYPHFVTIVKIKICSDKKPTHVLI